MVVQVMVVQAMVVQAMVVVMVVATVAAMAAAMVVVVGGRDNYSLSRKIDNQIFTGSGKILTVN